MADPDEESMPETAEEAVVSHEKEDVSVEQNETEQVQHEDDKNSNDRKTEADQRGWDPAEMSTLLVEAKALNDYLARHGRYQHDTANGDVETGRERVVATRQSEDQKAPPLFPGHQELIAAIAAATGQASTGNWKRLMESYSRVAGALQQQRGVSGKSILDTLNGKTGSIWKKKNVPIILGLLFFGIALILEYMKGWTAGISDPVELTGLSTFLFEMTGYLTPFLVPAVWGAIGACTYLAKKISDKLYQMSYEINRMQGITARIFLGAILGLITDILLFGSSGSVDRVAIGELELGTIVAAFTAGLAVKPIYRGFETLSEGIAKRFSPSRDEAPK